MAMLQLSPHPTVQRHDVTGAVITHTYHRTKKDNTVVLIVHVHVNFV